MYTCACDRFMSSSNLFPMNIRENTSIKHMFPWIYGKIHQQITCSHEYMGNTSKKHTVCSHEYMGKYINKANSMFSWNIGKYIRISCMHPFSYFVAVNAPLRYMHLKIKRRSCASGCNFLSHALQKILAMSLVCSFRENTNMNRSKTSSILQNF